MSHKPRFTRHASELVGPLVFRPSSRLERGTFMYRRNTLIT